MIHGDKYDLHRGTCCYVKAKNHQFNDELCALLEFNTDKNKWHVRMLSEKWKKKELLLPESSLKLGFALLPSSLKRTERHVKIDDESKQAGGRGRGLVAGMDIKKGWPLFEEPPMVVVRKNVESMDVHHAERYRAYSIMKANSQADPAFAKLLSAFDELTYTCDVPDHVRAGVKHLTGNLPADTSAAQRNAFAQQAEGVLMRFHANEVSFENGAVESSGFSGKSSDNDFLASAVFPTLSRLNHSCDPCLAPVDKISFCKQFKIKNTFEKDAGVMMVTALRDIAQGEPLTYNYGPKAGALQFPPGANGEPAQATPPAPAPTVPTPEADKAPTADEVEPPEELAEELEDTPPPPSTTSDGTPPVAASTPDATVSAADDSPSSAAIDRTQLVASLACAAVAVLGFAVLMAARRGRK